MEAVKWNKTIDSEEVDDKRKVRKDKRTEIFETENYDVKSNTIYVKQPKERLKISVKKLMKKIKMI